MLGKTENLTPSGAVFVLQNGKLVKLTQTRQLPTGTVVDALRGSVSLAASSGGVPPASDAKAKKVKKTKNFTGTFGGAVFKIAQTASGPNKGLTTLTLVEGAFKGDPSYASCKAKGAADAHAALSSRVLQTLRSRGSGRFRSRGRFAAGTVRGHRLDHHRPLRRHPHRRPAAQRQVTDLVRHKTVLVRAGHHYLARAPK